MHGTVRSAILFLDCEDVSWVVSPRSITLEFSGGHDFDRVNPEVFKVIELRCGRIESAARSRQGLVEHKCADVQFVDHHLIPSWGCVQVRTPVTVPFGEQMRARFPVVEVSLYLNVRTKRRPHPERYAVIVWRSSHVRSVGGRHVNTPLI